MKKQACCLGGAGGALLPMGAALMMAGSADLRAAAGMSLEVVFTALLSAPVILAVGRRIPKGIRMPANLLIIAGVVSLLHMLLEAYFPAAVNLLGVHLAAVAASPVLFCKAKGTAESGKALSVRGAVETAMFLAAVTLICALVREALGSATIWGRPAAFLEPVKIPILAGAYGGYLVMAFVLAAVHAICGMRETEDER